MAEQGEFGGPSFGGPSYGGGGGYDPTKSWAENQRQEQEDANLGGLLQDYNPRDNDLFEDPFAAAIRAKQQQMANGMQRNMPNVYDNFGSNIPSNQNNIETPLQSIGFKMGDMKVSTKELPASVQPSLEQLYDWGDVRMHGTNTNVDPYGQYGSSTTSSQDRDAMRALFDIMGWNDPPSGAGGFKAFSRDNVPGERFKSVVDMINPQTIDPRQEAIGRVLGKHFDLDNPRGTTEEQTDALMEEALNDILGGSSQQSLPNQSVVNQALREANARKKTEARDRAKALAKETARLKAKEEHRIQVLKDRADKKAAEEQWNPNIVPVEEVTPVQLPPLVIDDGPTTHEANVAKREATKARIATARGKTKAHLANLRSKGVSKKTMAKARTKAKARYAKIKSK